MAADAESAVSMGEAVPRGAPSATGLYSKLATRRSRHRDSTVMHDTERWLTLASSSTTNASLLHRCAVGDAGADSESACSSLQAEGGNTVRENAAWLSSTCDGGAGPERTRLLQGARAGTPWISSRCVGREGGAIHAPRDTGTSLEKPSFTSGDPGATPESTVHAHSSMASGCTTRLSSSRTSSGASSNSAPLSTSTVLTTAAGAVPEAASAISCSSATHSEPFTSKRYVWRPARRCRVT
mmetsp:Transcript_6885/g.18672  ORF Transcript_6885/g.18672 Transcript_6885/m.18672 type:complete len:240 (-) Transcript_6885:740-1459(-)